MNDNSVRWTISDGLRRYGVDASRLVHAFSVLNQLQPADLRALVAIMSAEGAGSPLTPGLLRRDLGLSSGGTSYVIDRLERAGHVRRVREHPTDSRVVHLRYTEQGWATGLAFFGPLGERTNEVMDRFTDAELEIVRRFVQAAADSIHDHVANLEPE
jgi:DNA-binding MarR family transcriptional regulator